MKPLGYAVVLVVVALAAAAGGYWYGMHHGSATEQDAPATQPAEEDKSVARVRTVAATIGEISETVTSYGSVIARAEDVRAVSVPYEARVARVLVTPGQPVAADTELIEVEPSPDALLALQDATNAVEVATREFEQVQQRFNDRLATNQELSQAQQALQSAQLKLKSLQDRGVAGGKQRVTSGAAGVLHKVDVQEGQIVAAGGPLAEVAAGTRIEVRIGVEPEVAVTLKADQPAMVHSVTSQESPPIAAKVRLVAHKINPDTRLADVFLSIPADASLLIDQYVRAEIATRTKQGLIVPRSAALPRDDEFVVFTVSDGHAKERKVSLGLTNDDQVELTGSEVKPGEQVVILGNHELEDGMAVELEQEAAASSQPAAHGEGAP